MCPLFGGRLKIRVLHFKYYMTKKTLDEISVPTFGEIANYAFHLWEVEGRQPGRDMDYWLEAEAHLLADRCYEAGMRHQSKSSSRARQSC